MPPLSRPEDRVAPIKDNTAGRAPEPVELFVKRLLVTYKAVKLYPPSSHIPRETANDAVTALKRVMRDRSDLRLSVTKSALVYEFLPALPGHAAYEEFAREFYARGLAEVRFHTGVSANDLVQFLATLAEPVGDITAGGGFEARLWERQVDTVTVREASTKIVDVGATEAEEQTVAGEPWPPSPARIDEILEGAFGARPRDQRLLVRFMQSARLLSNYLQETAHGRGAEVSLGRLASVVTEMARTAAGELAEDQPALMRSIAESIMGLDPDTRRRLLAEKLLAEARVDEAVAGVLRQLDLSDVCRALVEGAAEDELGKEGLARALRNLAAISAGSRDSVLTSAADAMRDAGVAADIVQDVVGRVAPTRIEVAASAAPSGAERLDSVLRLVDLAPSGARTMHEEDGGELTELRAEARRGVSDGDVVASLVSLLSLDRRPDVFGSIMALVEDSAGLLVEWGEYEIAGDVASALMALAETDEIDDGQRARVRAALTALASTESMRRVNAAMRVHADDSPEHRACVRLLKILGENTIEPMLEVLADEPDMGARKALVDLLSSLAPQHITTLGSHVADPRWYVVRNVVSILGKTRSSAALPALGRTLRHGDARVRRETIRALAGIHDRLAEEMLVAALSDDDEQNVRLAARYLGVAGVRGAVGALGQVARGDGRGNREPGPRVEAIEALGRIGGDDARRVLDELGRQRSIIRGARAREIRAAAEAALRSMEEGGR